MASNLMSLPLEVRDQIYGYVLSDDHDIFAHGVPALLEVRLELTRDILLPQTHEYYPYHRQQFFPDWTRIHTSTKRSAPKDLEIRKRHTQKGVACSLQTHNTSTSCVWEYLRAWIGGRYIRQGCIYMVAEAFCVLESDVVCRVSGEQGC